MQHACCLLVLLAFLVPGLSRADQLPVRHWPAVKRTAATRSAAELIKPRSILINRHLVGKSVRIEVWRVISVHPSKTDEDEMPIVCAERLFVSKGPLGAKPTFTVIDAKAPAEQRLVVKTIDPANIFVPTRGRTFRSLLLEMNLRDKADVESITLPVSIFAAVARHREAILDRQGNNPVLATFNIRGERVN